MPLVPSQGLISNLVETIIDEMGMDRGAVLRAIAEIQGIRISGERD